MPRVIHFEISADDPERAVGFYQKVFGWQIVKWDGPVDYWLIKTGDDEPGIDGAIQRREDPATRVTDVIGVDSVDAFVAKVEANGGRIILPKMAVPGVGYMAYFVDPEGNTFGMMQDDPDAQ